MSLKFKLGDRVEYDYVSFKYQYPTGMYKTDTDRRSRKLKATRNGYITGYRYYPIGYTLSDPEDHTSEFKRTGTIGCYLIAWDLSNNPDQVSEEHISPYNPANNPNTICSPYEDTLVKVIKTIRYEKFGYIYRLEQIMFSPDVMDMKVCYSLDGQYLGSNNTANMLCRKFGIREFIKTEQINWPACVGFNPTEQKWYGWSHRAIYGFEIGSTVKRGDCGYMPSSKEDMFNELLVWYEIDQVRDLGELGTCCTSLITYKHDDKHRNEYVKCSAVNPGESATENDMAEGISYGPEEIGLTMITKTEFSNGRDSITNEYFNAYPEVWGKGEWTAVTLDDAKQMAIDFASGVS